MAIDEDLVDPYPLMDKMKELVDQQLRAGHRYAEITLMNRISVGAMAVDGKIQQFGTICEKEDDNLFSIRLGIIDRNKNLLYSFKTLDVPSESPDDILEEKMNNYDNPLFGGIKLERYAKDVVLEPVDPFEEEFTLSPTTDYTSEVKEIACALSKKIKGIKRVCSKIKMIKTLKIYSNSDGTSYTLYYPITEISIQVYVNKRHLDANMPDKIFDVRRACGFELIKSIEGGKVAEEYKDITSLGIQHLGEYLMEEGLKKYRVGKNISMGTTDVVLSPAVAGYFIHESLFGHQLEACDFTKKLFSGEIRPFQHLLEKALAENNRELLNFGKDEITIVDSPVFKDKNGIYLNAIYPFSDDGVKTADKILVKRGELHGILSTRIDTPYLKKRYGNLVSDLSPINAHSFGENCVPMSRMSTIYIEGTKKGLTSEEMIEQLPPGGLVIYTPESGGSTSIDTFEISVTDVYIKEANNELTPLKGYYTLYGTLYRKEVTSFPLAKQMLVGNRKEFSTDGGVCGRYNPGSQKMEEIPSAVGAPYLYLPKIHYKLFELQK